MKTAKIGILMLLCLSILMSACSCAMFKGPASDEQLRELLRELLPKDANLNKFIWGDAFETAEEVKENDKNSKSCVYYTVSADAPYHSVESIKKDMEALYTAEICEIIYNYAFENSDITMARFCNEYEDEQNTKVKDLRIDVTANHQPYELTAKAMISTAVVIRSTNTIIEGEMSFTAGEAGKVRKMTVKLLNTDGSWKLDTQTWIVEVEE